MSRPEYEVKQSYVGDGSLDTYEFNFKIEDLTQLLIIEVVDGEITEYVRGDDVTYLDSVTFDSVNGGGEVVLAANLADGASLHFLLANDEPTQPYEFRNKGSFSLRAFEMALDFILGAVQRLKFQVKNSLRINDADDESLFDGELPLGVADNANAVLCINSTGTGFNFNSTVAQIMNGVSFLFNGSNLELVNADQLAISTIKPFQKWKVGSAGGLITMNNKPFGTVAPPDGTIITVIGTSDTELVKFVNADESKGCILNGDLILGNGNAFQVMYDQETDRYIFLNRSF